jgi:hypothetical protein
MKRKFRTYQINEGTNPVVNSQHNSFESACAKATKDDADTRKHSPMALVEFAVYERNEAGKYSKCDWQVGEVME